MYPYPVPFFKTWQGRLLKRTFIAIGLLLSAGILLLALIAAWIYPSLESLDKIANYRPKLPLRIYSADNVMIGEFGFEYREFVSIEKIPTALKLAVLSIEDDRFYEHIGVDFIGIARAALNNLLGRSRQGASTITQQVARNFYLNNEQSYLRKFYEVLLAYKIERNLSKDKILELYLNQIYLGQRAYGFAAAAKTYFDKSIDELTLAEAALLAGLPKAPSSYNPFQNPRRAQERQAYILQRMFDLGYISATHLAQAQKEPLRLSHKNSNSQAVVFSGSEFIAETVRRQMVDKFGEEVYGSGYIAHTTIFKSEQDAAYQAVREGLFKYDKRYGYRGPEALIKFNLGKDYPAQLERQAQIEQAFSQHRNSGDVFAALVLEATPQSILVQLANGDELELKTEAWSFAQPWLQQQRLNTLPIGALIRLIRTNKGWQLTQLPKAEAGFIAINAKDGSIRALVGGFDFNLNQFNHVTQGQRQLGSVIKPFIYSAALDQGATPESSFLDAPPNIPAEQTGGVLWEPKNYDGGFSGELVSMQDALARSLNLVAVDITRAVGLKAAQDHLVKFGFDRRNVPAFYTLALGAGSGTLEEVASAYAVFANGGYLVKPYLLTKVTDRNQNLLIQYSAPKTAAAPNQPIISARNVVQMDRMLQGVVQYGTAQRAKALGRGDVGGKTGTTNDETDGWFSGYMGHVVGAAWVGFDTPRKLGERETGGSLALPIWLSYMKNLRNIPVVTARAAYSAPVDQAAIGESPALEELPPPALSLPAEVDSKAKNSTPAAPLPEPKALSQPAATELKPAQ